MKEFGADHVLSMKEGCKVVPLVLVCGMTVVSMRPNVCSIKCTKNNNVSKKSICYIWTMFCNMSDQSFDHM